MEQRRSKLTTVAGVLIILILSIGAGIYFYELPSTLQPQCSSLPLWSRTTEVNSLQGPQVELKDYTMFAQMAGTSPIYYVKGFTDVTWGWMFFYQGTVAYTFFCYVQD